MSKVDELIRELCPDGVERFQLGEIAEYSKGRIGANQVDATNYVGVDNLLPNCGGKTKSEHVPSNGRLTEFRAGDILVGNIRPYLKKAWLADTEGGTSADVLVLRIDGDFVEQVVPEFLFYCLSSDHFFAFGTAHARGGKMPRGDKKAILTYTFPLPPLEIQEEIVRILDTFVELDRKLEKEIAGREKQLIEARLKIFSDNEWEKAHLQDFCKIVAGGDRPKDVIRGEKQATEDRPYPVFSNGTGEDALYGYSSTKRINDKAVTISARGTIGYHTVREPGFTPIVRLITLIPDSRILSADYLDAALYVSEVLGTQGGIPQLTVPMVKTAEIPLPPLEVQAEITAKLDTFTEYIDDLKRERELRQKQYEYYRDQLLDFKVKE